MGAVLSVKKAEKRFLPEEVDKLKENFENLALARGDENQIDKATFMKYFLPDDSELSARLFDVFDAKNTGTISYREFISGLALCARGRPVERLEIIFQMADRDQSQSLSKDELKGILSSSFFKGCELQVGAAKEEKVSCPSVRALYSYKASRTDELSFSGGDVLTLVGKEGPWSKGWFCVEVQGKKGLIPGNYVEDVSDSLAGSQDARHRHVMSVTERLIEDVFKTADLDKDGKLDKDEFISWASSSYPISQLLRCFSAFVDMSIPEPGPVISGPTMVQHIGHIGWDPHSGFKVENIPAETLAIFKKAGIKKKELQDPETAKFLVETLDQNVRRNAQPPPPPPLAPSAAVPPPPPAVPALPPPHPTGPTPPPAPPAAAGLLSAIKKGTELKHVEPEKFTHAPSKNPILSAIRQGIELHHVDQADIDALSVEEKDDLSSVLARAINSRRQYLIRDDEDADADDDEW